MIANAPATTRMDEIAIEEVRAGHIGSMNSGDIEAFVACFAADAVEMPPNSPSNHGKAAIRTWIQGVLSLFACRFSLSVDEVRLAGDWAFERGCYTLALTPKAGGEPMQESGKYITVYERQPDGSWQIARDIWNTDQAVS